MSFIRYSIDSPEFSESCPKLFWQVYYSDTIKLLLTNCLVDVENIRTFVFHTRNGKLLSKYYALIDRARGPYEDIFVLTFNAYEPKKVMSMRLECQNKYFPYRPKSRLIRALLYTYTNTIVYDEILLS